MGTSSFLGAKSDRGVTLTHHHLLVPRSRKSRAITLLPLWAVRPVQSLSACTREHFTFITYHIVAWKTISYFSDPHSPHTGRGFADGNLVTETLENRQSYGFNLEPVVDQNINITQLLWNFLLLFSHSPYTVPCLSQLHPIHTRLTSHYDTVYY